MEEQPTTLLRSQFVGSQIAALNDEIQKTGRFVLKLVVKDVVPAQLPAHGPRILATELGGDEKSPWRPHWDVEFLDDSARRNSSLCLYIHESVFSKLNLSSLRPGRVLQIAADVELAEWSSSDPMPKWGHMRNLEEGIGGRKIHLFLRNPEIVGIDDSESDKEGE